MWSVSSLANIMMHALSCVLLLSIVALLDAEKFDYTIATSQRTVHTFDANDTVRYFSLLRISPATWRRHQNLTEYWMIAKRLQVHEVGRKGLDYLVLWQGCLHATLTECLSHQPQRLSDWHDRGEVNAAHNTAIFFAGATLWALGGRDDEHRHARNGVHYLARFRSREAVQRRVNESAYADTKTRSHRTLPIAFRGTHHGCIERRSSFGGRCEFDGRFSVARKGSVWLVYGRANVAADSSTRGNFGGRHVQVASFDPTSGSISYFQLCTFIGYPREPGRNDNIYFAAVNPNPVDGGRTVLGLFPVTSTALHDPCVAIAVSFDGVRFSQLACAYKSTATPEGRTTDHPVDGLVYDHPYIYFFVHVAVNDIADPSIHGPPRIIRRSIHFKYLQNFTRAALHQLQDAIRNNRAGSDGSMSKSAGQPPGRRHWR